MTEVMNGAQAAGDLDASYKANLEAELNEVQTQLAQLRTMHDNQGINIARYQESEARLTAKVQRQHEQMEEFKREVVRLASEAAEEHNWCSVIDDILGELGLARPKPSYRAELTIQVQFSAQRTDSRDCPSTSWVRDSIRREDLEQAIRQNFQMDGDNENVDISYISFGIDDVEEQEA